MNDEIDYDAEDFDEDAYVAHLDHLANDLDADDYYGPTDEFFYADEWDLEEHYDAEPFEDDCYESCF